MKQIYNDYPEVYPESVVTKLNKEWSAYTRHGVTLSEYINKENNMNYSKFLQNDINSPATNPANNSETTPSNNGTPIPPNNPNTLDPAFCPINENYKLYSLIASNYCSIIQLMNNIIAKTSSAKREIYQEINAALKVDSATFNNTFYTSCNIERYTYCNYNQLVYTTMLSFINLTDSLSRLVTTELPSGTASTASILRDNAFALFYQFVDSHPIRV